MGKNEYLKVYENKFELIREDKIEVFEIGKQSEDAKKRYNNIRSKLEEGFLTGIIEDIEENGMEVSDLGPIKEDLDRLVEGVNDNEGRALLVLTIIQCCVKSIERTQNIRLHKGNHGTNTFSFKEGISMRSIDGDYITPVLRDKELLKLSKFGAFMTRTLSESYPYTSVFSAKIKGAKDSWLKVVDYLEDNNLDDVTLNNTLRYILNKLVICRDENNPYQNNIYNRIKLIIEDNENMIDIDKTYDIICKTIENYPRHARLFEISIHSFFNSIENKEKLMGNLSKLSNMRKANKKANDIGDVQIIGENETIIEAWDCKYAKLDLEQEIKELEDKIASHENLETAGFITDKDIEINDIIKSKISDIEKKSKVNIKILSFREFIDIKTDELCLDKVDIGKEWLKMYSATITRNNIEKAPLDEPNIGWVRCLDETIDKYNFN